MAIQPQNFSLPLLKKKQVNRDVVSFYFDRTLVKNYDFLPGQYNRVTIPSVVGDPRGNSRFFSIASSPLDRDFLMITTKISQSPFKQTLLHLPEGSLVNFFGPVGRFVFDESDTRHHILLAGGIGLTPYHSMITYAATKNLTTPITLIVSFSTQEEFIYFDELVKISTDHSNIRVVYTVTRPSQGSPFWGAERLQNQIDPGQARMTDQWSGETGRISADMIKKYCKDVDSALFYVCGSEVVIKALEELVLSMGISKDNIKKEQFVGY